MVTLMASSDLPPPDHRTLGFERFVFFSDAVFAIAITLLVLDLKLPNGGTGPFDLTPIIPKLISFGLSFYVIGRYWMVHHQLFDRIQGCDGKLLTTNLAFLAGIAFLPFPTSVVILEQPQPGPVIFYTLSVAVVGLLMMAVIVVATRPAIRPGVTTGARARWSLNAAGPPLVFLLAAAVATQQPRAALFLILLLIPIGWVFEAVGQRLQVAIDKPKPLAQPQ
jgi:uncharacterized membrane protein